MGAGIGTGTSITFGTSGFNALILSVNGEDVSRAVIDITHAGTLTNRRKIVGNLVDPGTVRLQLLFDPGERPPYNQPPETITLVVPDPDGGSPDPSLSGTGFISSWSYAIPGGGESEDKMTQEIEITWDGATGPSWSS